MATSRRRRLRTALWLILVCVPVALGYEYVSWYLDLGVGHVSWVGAFIGVVIALPLAVLEESGFDERMRRLPFTVAIVTKAVVYIASLLVAFMSAGLLIGSLNGLGMADFYESLGDPDYYIQAGVGFVLYLVIVFVRHIDRLLGPGVLLRYILGRYHRPRRETRIFMFLDLKSSTVLGEAMKQEDYYGLLNEFFRDISGPVLNRSGEIYEYVGDEAVITWTDERGIRDANCVQVFRDIDRVIDGKRDWYMARYGVVPEYRAGVHGGEVIAAEMGDLKRALVFNGDVLNTASRIQGECKRLDRRLLSSAELVSRLALPSSLTPEPMGPAQLRGKSEPVELVALA